MHLLTDCVNNFVITAAASCYWMLITFAMKWNHTVGEWRRSLSACVDAEGGRFEHCL